MFNKKFTLEDLQNMPLINFEADTVVIYNGIVQEELSTFAFQGVLNVTKNNFNNKPIHLIIISDEKKRDYSIFMLNVFSGLDVEIMASYICIGNANVKSKVAINISGNSSLTYHNYFNLTEKASLERIVDVNVQENASYKNNFFLKNDGNFKTISSVNLMEETSCFDFKAFYSVGKKSETKLILDDNHLENKTSSDILLKGVVDDDANVYCELSSSANKNISEVEISQYHKAMLLSNTTKIKSKPAMKVFAEDVVANHGFTVSNIDEDEVFFLKNRGVSYSDAEVILKDSFSLEVFNNIESEKLREELIKNIL